MLGRILSGTLFSFISLASWSLNSSGKPESTEGGGWVSVLKRQEGAPLNLG